MKSVCRIYIAMSMNIFAIFFCYSMDRLTFKVAEHQELLDKLKTAIDTIIGKKMVVFKLPASLQIQPEIAAEFDPLAREFVATFNKHTLRAIYTTAKHIHEINTYFLYNLFMYIFVNKHYWILHKKLAFNPVLFCKNSFPTTLSMILADAQARCVERKLSHQSYAVNTDQDFFSLVLFYETIKLNRNVIEEIKYLTCYNKKTSTQFYFNPITGHLEQYIKMSDTPFPVSFETCPQEINHSGPRVTDFDEEIKTIEIGEIGYFLINL